MRPAPLIVLALAACGGGRASNVPRGDAGILDLAPLTADAGRPGAAAQDLERAAARIARAHEDINRLIAQGRTSEGKVPCELALAASGDLAAAADAGRAEAPARAKLRETCILKIYPAVLRADLAAIDKNPDDLAFICDKDRAVAAVLPPGHDEARALAARCRTRWSAGTLP